MLWICASVPVRYSCSTLVSLKDSVGISTCMQATTVTRRDTAGGHGRRDRHAPPLDARGRRRPTGCCSSFARSRRAWWPVQGHATTADTHSHEPTVKAHRASRTVSVMVSGIMNSGNSGRFSECRAITCDGRGARSPAKDATPGSACQRRRRQRPAVLRWSRSRRRTVIRESQRGAPAGCSAAGTAPRPSALDVDAGTSGVCAARHRGHSDAGDEAVAPITARARDSPPSLSSARRRSRPLLPW
jgi:hypothetical protein